MCIHINISIYQYLCQILAGSCPSDFDGEFSVRFWQGALRQILVGSSPSDSDGEHSVRF